MWRPYNALFSLRIIFFLTCLAAAAAELFVSLWGGLLDVGVATERRLLSVATSGG